MSENNNELEKLREENRLLQEKVELLTITNKVNEQFNEDSIAYYTHFQMLLDINSRLNSQIGDDEKNVRLALTSLTGYLDADKAIILQKDEKGEYHLVYDMFHYEPSFKKDIDTFIHNYNLAKSLPSLVETVEKDTIIDLPDIRALIPEAEPLGIDHVTFAPIKIKQQVDNILIIINQRKNANIIRFCTPFFADAIDRINKNYLINLMAITDNFTGLYDRDYYNGVCASLRDEKLSSLGVVEIDLNRLKSVNDTLGHEAGDIYIKTIASIVHECFESDDVFRIGGDEFSIICKNRTKEYIEDCITRVNEELANLVIKCPKGDITDPQISVGMAFSDDVINIHDLTVLADEEMYKDKERYYRENNIERRK